MPKPEQDGTPERVQSPYGIDWSKVPEGTNLEDKRPEATAVTEAGRNPSGAKGRRAAAATTTAKSTRSARTTATEPGTTTTTETGDDATDGVDKTIESSTDDGADT